MDYFDQVLNVSEESINYYRKNGHVRIDNVCEASEIEFSRHAINSAVQDRKSQLALKPLEERDTYGKAFLQIMNLWPDYPDVAKFVMAKRFASVAAKLLGVSKVRIYHDQALYKEPYGGLTPWHQDQYYWPLETDQILTMWMPLIDVTETMGTLNFASGTGNVGYLGDIPISDESEKMLSDMCQKQGFEIVNHGGMNAGDATFHSGWCLHGAKENQSNVMREAMTVIWYADETKIITDPDPQERWNKGRRDDMTRWLPDRQPGQMADGKLNPLIDPFS
ncbi:phytanoyl-CoA dioxygenase family protein [Marinomonas sp. 15G1-11]|uniref:Phytanoyl-CoA dioxygenase family protein n=1 Tax=Marinomonas phaeophyticola TaxID=3004091 RepID=A0ABT4JTA4_9GAMM|nr:phytanoyl-CoA dioxygenase family protein [Marinomonas sp. 15G1-11]MCZ2721641.1 phytanoyl-CoA dioxygenase family protein [Marinomonas sp. 15G1-11]